MPAERPRRFDQKLFKREFPILDRPELIKLPEPKILRKNEKTLPVLNRKEKIPLLRPTEKLNYKLKRGIPQKELDVLRAEVKKFIAAKSMTVAEAYKRGASVECVLLSKRYTLSEIIQVYGSGVVAKAGIKLVDAGLIRL
jgi:hypothetical protein